MPQQVFVFGISLKSIEKYQNSPLKNNKFHLSFTMPNKLINIYDINNQKSMTEPFQYNKLEMTDLTIGKKIQLDFKLNYHQIGKTNLKDNNNKYEIQILTYADQFTKKHFAKLNSNTSIFFMIKPGFVQNGKFGQILSIIQKQFQIKRFKMFLLSKQNCEDFIVTDQMQNAQNHLKNVQYLTSGPLFGFELNALNSFIKIQKLVGHHNPTIAKKSEPKSFRSIYGENIIKNCCYSTKNIQSAQKQLQYIFSQKIKEVKPKIKDAALCLIKPHVLIQNKLGEFIQELVKKKYQINAMKICQLPFDLVKQYMELYKFLPQYAQNIEHLSSGKCCLIQVSNKKSIKLIQEFKQDCGPYDPGYAKKTKSQSLRSLFGKTRTLNGVHCTQLEQDAQQQLKLIFQQ